MKQTVEAEIKAVMHPQRVRDGAIRMEMQAAKWTAEGAVKSLVIRLSILRREGIRQLPGI